ncbi:MAG: hypothetical protein J0H67_07510 [Rhodospirillales bacterium]|nr:hypothetical protein [Rhodospirillales bacterium]
MSNMQSRRQALADLMQVRGGRWAKATEERFGVDCITRLTTKQIEALAAEAWEPDEPEMVRG